VTAALISFNVVGIPTLGCGEVPMEDAGDKFLELIHELEDVASSVTTQQALAEFDEITLQVFWRKWPQLSSWAGQLWSMLSAELAGPSQRAVDAELDETGGSG
jgi:hypothetical protein